MEQVLIDNLMEEVRLTYEAMPDKDETDFAMWKNSFEVGNTMVYITRAKCPAISMSFNMGWQQRSSGKLNFFPTKMGVSSYYSPYATITWKNLDCNQVKIPFGQSVQPGIQQA
jgi:hypothetical protein